MYHRILSKVFTWAKTNGYCGIELEGRGEHIWAFIRCWDNRVNTSGPSFGAGTTANFVGSVCQSWIASAAAWMRKWLCWDESLMRFVPIFSWSQCTALHMRLWRHTSTMWVVGITRNWLKIRCLNCSCSSDAWCSFGVEFFVTRAFRMIPPKHARNALVWLPAGSTFSLTGFQALC